MKLRSASRLAHLLQVIGDYKERLRESQYAPSMTLRQRPHLPRLLNRKPPGPITALEILEPIDRDPTRARRKLQQPALLLRVPGADDLPEVLDHVILLLVAAVIGVFLPVVDVDVGDAADQQFEFALVEHVDEVGGDELVEAGDEGVELFGDAFLDLPFCDESGLCRVSRSEFGYGVWVVGLNALDILFLGLIGDSNLASSTLQIHRLCLPELVVIHREGQVYDVLDIVLQHPGQISVEVFVDALHVLDLDFLA